MDRGWVARSTMDRRWRGPKGSERGGALTGAWPPATLEHGSSPTGAQQREGNMGNPARTTAWRLGDDGETAGERKLGNSDAQASKEGGESDMGEVR
jgi:hypothetical protein